ncbi:MAG TPA: metalloregulator ArsR/SmtB family transcription factor [Candidatus Sulfotelmatobacter sp.]|nr:metalloregulator ArsR/SmtB family transcription factor [Candidatus Sulfotelmatobacter sp.]
MSRRIRNKQTGQRSRAIGAGGALSPHLPRSTPATLFAALGDKTRLLLVTRLSGGEPHSISQLTAGSRLTRQAVTKHLRILENVGIVRSRRAGRESRYQFNPGPLAEPREYLDFVSQQWDQALARLKAFVEN